MYWGCLKAKTGGWVGVSFVAPFLYTSEESLMHFFRVVPSPQCSEGLNWILLWLFSQPLVLHGVLQPPYHWFSPAGHFVLGDTKLDTCLAATQMGIILSANVLAAVLPRQPWLLQGSPADPSRFIYLDLQLLCAGHASLHSCGLQLHWDFPGLLHLCLSLLNILRLLLNQFSSLSWCWGAAALCPNI